MSYQPRETTDAFERARLPFLEAQAALTGHGRAGAPRLTDLGWHGTEVDLRRGGSYAVVQREGPHADLVDRVVRLTLRGPARAPLYAYVVGDDPDLPDPITVSRRLFLALGHLWEDTLPVTLEVVPTA